MQTVYDIFYEILIADNRWMLIVHGLCLTVVITLLSLFFGTLLGAGVYWMSLSRRRWVSQVASAWRYVVRGIPLLVLLIFFFYVVFSGGCGVFAAVVAFSINFSNLACTLFETSMDAVGRDQVEAGRALGFNNLQNLRYVVLPQALKNFLPTYKYQAVSMVKSTSIVGYVAVKDLLQSIEVIRSSSHQSFLPLLLVTAIYFLLARLLCLLLDYIAVKTTRV